jgi:hypothetical protein
MGVLNIVFGALFLLVCFCDGIMLVAGRDPDTMAMWEQMKDQVPGFVAVRAGGVLVHIVLFILLIVAGIGLLNMARWGRFLSIFYGVASILFELAMLIYQLGFINPAMSRFFNQLGGAQFGGPDIGGMMMTILTIVTVVIYALVMLYSVLLLIMMMTSTVSAAFGGRAAESGYEAGTHYDDADDYDRRRPRDGWND